MLVEAHDLPFAEGYFDAIVSVDAYHYFGTDALYLPYLSRFLAPGGHIGIVVPGLTTELDDGLPEHLKPHWEPDFWTFHSHVTNDHFLTQHRAGFDLHCHGTDLHGIGRLKALGIPHEKAFQFAAAAKNRNIRAIELHRNFRDERSGFFHACFYNGAEEKECCDAGDGYESHTD